MADASRLQTRGGGTTSRDVAFSNIFGNAPPPGRSSTMTSPVIPNFEPMFEVSQTGGSSQSPTCSTASGSTDEPLSISANAYINERVYQNVHSAGTNNSELAASAELVAREYSASPATGLINDNPIAKNPTTEMIHRHSQPHASPKLSSPDSPGSPGSPDTNNSPVYHSGINPRMNSHGLPPGHHSRPFSTAPKLPNPYMNNSNNSNNSNKSPTLNGGLDQPGQNQHMHQQHLQNRQYQQPQQSHRGYSPYQSLQSPQPPPHQPSSQQQFMGANRSVSQPTYSPALRKPVSSSYSQHQNYHQQQNIASNNLTTTANNNGIKNHFASPTISTQNSNRTMSLTNAALRYDRSDMRPNNVTLSGRVIPQRQQTDLLMSQNSKSANALFGAKSSNGALNGSSNNTGGNGTSSILNGNNSRSDSRLQNLNHRSKSTSSNSESGRPSISPHSTILAASRSPMVYPAMLSRVAEKFRQMITLGDKQKNGLTYKNAFTGSEAVDAIALIIKTPDRNLALLLGRALDAQKFFHDVTYDHRLRDTANEVYQLNELIIDEKEEQQPYNHESIAQDHEQHGLNHHHHHHHHHHHQKREGVVEVNGIFTLLAECYSPTCTRDQLCYSIACPRRLEQQARLHLKPQPGLKRAESRLSIHGDDEVEQKLWIHTVSKEIADSVDDKEKKRQEVICEVIYTERDFVKDLEYLRDFWIKPLSSSNVIPEPRREKFIRTVFSHILEVHSVNIKLAEALTRRQQLAPVVRQIGDVFLEHVTKFEPFIRYGANQLYGKYEFEREKRINPTFAKFVDDTERMKEARKLELNGYLTKPTTRLARYPLLLEAVLKHSSDENPDTKNLPEVISIIKDFLIRVNVETGRAENRFNLFQLSQSLVFNHGEYVDLKLTDENRQIVFKGFLKKRQDQKDNQGSVQVYLFDNSLLFIKIKTVNKREQLKVHRKPIPLELLTVAEGEEIIPKSVLAKRPTSSSLISSKPALRNDSGAGTKFAITFQHLGRRGYDLTLYSPTYIGRKKWIEHIEQQKQVLVEKADIYTIKALQKRHFSASDRVNCLAPFDGGRKLLYGTDDGIFMSDVKYGPSGPTASTPVKVINIPNVTQIDVLDEYMTLLALSDKALYSWPLDCLDTPNPVNNFRRSKKVSGHINFYKVDMCLGRILVCTVKSGTTNSTVKVMEPFDPQPRSRKQQPLRRLLQTQSEGLKIFKEFYVPSETLSISFLRKSLCVGCAKGFEIVNLDTLETQSLLDPADTSLDFAIRKEALKPISIYRIHNDFLLNYSDFSFFVNGNGWRSRPDFMIYWEGLPSHFALSYPYLIAFDSSFIEIRHIETADLVRVITGENIRFLHESTREIVYVHEDENGFDEVVSLDFWEKANKRDSKVPETENTKVELQGHPSVATTVASPTVNTAVIEHEDGRNNSMNSSSDWTLVSND